MTSAKSVPTLKGEKLYIPFVGAIIYRDSEKGLEVLVQVRDKGSDKEYSGSVEIPGGKLRAFEDVYYTLKREAKEESGMEITFVEGENEREDFENRGHQSSLIKPYCVTQMKQGPFIGLIFLCRAKGEPLQKTNETKEAKWMPFGELKDLVSNQPEKIYTAFLSPLIKFTREYS